MKWAALALVALAVAGTIDLSATGAQARKRRPANNEICFDPGLTAAERADCKKQYAAAKTADARSKIHKDFKRKASAAKSAAPPSE